MMICVNGFIYYTKKNRWGTWWRINGPLCFTLLAVPLIMADLVRHLLQDYDIWKECPRDGPPKFTWNSSCTWYSNQYKCTHPPPGCCPNENMAHLSPMGWLFTFFFTYTGFACLFVGVLWNANIIKKLKEIKEEWRRLRNQGVPNDVV